MKCGWVVRGLRACNVVVLSSSPQPCYSLDLFLVFPCLTTLLHLVYIQPVHLLPGGVSITPCLFTMFQSNLFILALKSAIREVVYCVYTNMFRTLIASVFGTLIYPERAACIISARIFRYMCGVVYLLAAIFMDLIGVDFSLAFPTK